MHDAYIGGRSENNNIKCVVVHNNLGWKNRTTWYNCRFSATSLALWVIFSVSWLWNIFSSFTEPFNYFCNKFYTICYHKFQHPGQFPYYTTYLELLFLAIHVCTDRAFPVAATRIWNGLPPDVTTSPSLSLFKRRLKTVLFSSSYSDSIS